MFKSWIFCLMTLPLLNVSEAAVISPDEIVAKADEVRNPQLDYTIEVIITSIKPDGSKRTKEYDVFVKGKDRTLVKTLAPANERGVSILMLDKELWSFLPNLSQPVRISLQQRLIGEVANGDIVRANFAGDYHAKFLQKDKKYYVLELSAKSEDVTYNRVVYWVKKSNFHPAHAKFYAVSGRLLKTCSYERYKELAGRPRPSRLVMKDPLVRGQISIMEYHNCNITNLPEKYFTKDYLKKLKY